MKPRTTISSVVIALFHGLFLFLPLIFTSVNDELFEFNKLLVIYGAAVIFFFLWIARSILDKKIYFQRTVFDIPILLFCLSQILSTLFSIQPHTSIFGYYTRFNGGLLSVFAYTICYYAFTFFVDKRSLQSLFTSLFLGSFIAALYAFPEHFGHSPSCLLLTGSFDVACWVQDVQSRVFGTFGQPNWLAAYILMLLPLLLYRIATLFFSKKYHHEIPIKKTLQSTHVQTSTRRISEQVGSLILYVLLFVLLTSVLFFTASRSGLLGMGALYGVFICSVYVLLFRSTAHTQQILVRTGYFFAGVLVVTFLISVQFNAPLSSFIFSRMTPVKNQIELSTPSPQQSGPQLEVGGSDSGKIRTVVWKGALKVFQRYPLFGSGVETFGYSYFKDRLPEHNLLSEWDFLYNKAHNEFLNYLATTGLVGFSAYVFMYGSFTLYPVIWAYRNKSISEKDIFFVASISSALTALAVSNFFGFSTVVVSLLTFVYPAIFVIWSSMLKPHIVESNVKISGQEFGAITICGVLALILFLNIVRMWKADELFARGKALYNQNDLGSAIETLQQAASLFPDPSYHDELSYTAAKGALALFEAGESTAAAELATYAINESNITISMNSVHTNFYKTRARVFLILAQMTPNYYNNAITALREVQALSPTDPKIPYNLALIAQQQGRDEEYKLQLEKVLQLRPVDEPARYAYGQVLEEQGEFAKAKENYEYMLQFINPENTLVKERLASISGKLQK